MKEKNAEGKNLIYWRPMKARCKIIRYAYASPSLTRSIWSSSLFLSFYFFVKKEHFRVQLKKKKSHRWRTICISVFINVITIINILPGILTRWNVKERKKEIFKVLADGQLISVESQLLVSVIPHSTFFYLPLSNLIST